MAIDKINLFNPAQNMKPINATQAVGRHPSAEVGGSSASNNPFKSGMFSGSTSGLNQMQPGDVVSTPAQAGKPAGVSRLLYNA